ncbi:MAG: hypothetical protein H7Z39_05300 [Burkholderiaceae bacterium]|nr:hypothetical protein [Burkholderiaceae bacterium]
MAALTMTLCNRPGKAEVRAWLARRRLASAPPPCPEEIRRMLGWSCTGQDATPAAVVTQVMLRAIKN